MARRTRRILPDNLDPLVDTLANVVGILVIVIALTRIELGDALGRVAQLERTGIRSDLEHARSMPEGETKLARRAARLRSRAEGEEGAAGAVAEELTKMIAELPELAGEPGRDEDADALARQIERTQDESAARQAHGRFLEAVPARLVARLPDPRIERGYESWILVRYGRVFLLDRERLYEEGTEAIARLLNDAITRGVRPDEYESAALYLRKHPAGTDGFRWLLKTQPSLRVVLGWPDPGRGVSPEALARHPAWRAWLARRSPERDFIRFHVWNDSFEAYLQVRQRVEAAHFRAGWKGYEADQEYETGLRFGPKPPRERDVEVD